MMALYHFHVTQIKRSNGSSAVASAAYRAGERLYSERYDEVNNYTHKGGVVCSEILLPPQAPEKFRDRQTLRNEVEAVEKRADAQLAYSFDLALQNEVSQEENIALARQFIEENLVGKGIIADYAVHDPEDEDGGIRNPHVHIMCPIRPLNEDGSWGSKLKQVPVLNAEGKLAFCHWAPVGHALESAVVNGFYLQPDLQLFRKNSAFRCHLMQQNAKC